MQSRIVSSFSTSSLDRISVMLLPFQDGCASAVAPVGNQGPKLRAVAPCKLWQTAQAEARWRTRCGRMQATMSVHHASVQQTSVQQTRLRVALGDYAHTRPLKDREIASPSPALDFDAVQPVYKFFDAVARE